MSRPGWFKVWRESFDHWLAEESKPFSPLLAWYYLIGWAAWETEERSFQKQLFQLNRGEHVTTFRQLARDWGWHHERVARFLERLKNATQITTAIRHSCIVVTICNYERYQSDEPETRQESASKHANHAPAVRQAHATDTPATAHEVRSKEQTTTEELKNPVVPTRRPRKPKVKAAPQGGIIDHPNYGFSRGLLLSVGVDGTALDELAQQHTVRRIWNAVVYAAGKENPGGMAREALEKGWSVPDVCPQSVEDELRAKAEAEIKRREELAQPKSKRLPGESEDDWLRRVQRDKAGAGS